MTSENPPPEPQASQPEASDDAPESSNEDKKLRDCFYCNAPAEGKPFKVWVHHKQERKEAYVNVARCKRCARRHEGWFYVIGVIAALAIVTGVVKKQFEFGQPGEWILTGTILALLALAVAVHHFWPRIFEKLFGYSGEQRGHEDPIVKNFLQDGYELGRYPRDDDGNIIEQTRES